MKKILLSVFVLFSFVIYSFQQRHEGSKLVLAPQQTSPNSQTATSSNNQSPQSSAQTNGAYKDGTYDGSVADAYYGNIQVRVTVQGGNITDVQFLQYPNDRRNSIEINSQAMPYLKQEAIKAQNSHVDIISGATDTSNAFIQSLSAALAKAS